MIKVAMITYTPIKTILYLILMVTGLKGEIMTNESYADIQLRAANLAPYASEMDSVYHSLFKSGPAGDFITNIMGQETHYGSPISGYDPTNMYSMGLTQVDPVRYQDLLDDYTKLDVYKDRIGRVNQYMQSKPGYEDWDMTKLATITDGKYSNMSKYASDPLSNMMLTRMLLMKDPNPIPQDIVGQAGVWKNIWNTLSGTGNITEFTDKYNKFRTVDATMQKNANIQNAFTGP